MAAGPLEDGAAAYGRGDYTTALRLFRRLADQGDAGAQFSLGAMHFEGTGVPQDYAAAMKWYRKAADQGDAGAQFNVARMYENGQGVPQDFATAVTWYREAAEQGLADAQINLGTMYFEGMGVPQDYVRAHMLFNIAAARAPAWDTKTRDTAVKNRNLVAAKMTPAQIAEAQKLTREWKPKSN